MFDRELIGFMYSQGETLGSYLYDEVAALDRASRARLWVALDPLTDFDAAGDLSGTPEAIAGYQAEWRRVCKQLGCSDRLADAFILTRDEWLDAHVVSGLAEDALRAGSRDTTLVSTSGR